MLVFWSVEVIDDQSRKIPIGFWTSTFVLVDNGGFINFILEKTMTHFEELVTMSIGEASMCWSEIPKGVFDSTRAAILAKKIIESHDDITNFDKLQKAIETAPMTWLPALFIKICETSIEKKVFLDQEAMLKIVQKIYQATAPIPFP